MKCQICKKQCKGNLIIKDINILDSKTNEVKEWHLCSECFNLWASQRFDKLRERLKNE